MVAPAYRTADATVSAFDAAAVTPSNSTDLAPTRALYVGTGGNLRVTTAYGADVVFANVPTGSILPVQVTRVWATNTTASSVIALY